MRNMDYFKTGAGNEGPSLIVQWMIVRLNKRMAAAWYRWKRKK